jgi:dihydrofolate reductase
MALGLIFARTRNGVIGRGGQMPWHLPEDLAHFKRVTLGQPVIMGRKTWDSIPARFRPLPGRDNWVITRQADWQAPGARVAHSLSEALAQMPAGSQPWVMGGGEIYAQAMALANQAVVTEIDLVVDDGDTFAPQFGSDWAEVARESHVSANGLKFDFVWLRKNS